MGLYERIIDKENLNRAWDKIWGKHTVAGTDGVTEEEFQTRRKEMILQLQIELQTERYNTRPAKQVILEKNGSERTISILCMRDKVVQQAICQEFFLEKCGLRLNENKTQLGKLEEGAEFLGYRFDNMGKKIPVKACHHLEERLEDCWLKNIALPIEEKIRACREIIGGWEQYYRGERIPGSIYEYVTVLGLCPKANRKELEETRFRYDNAHKDILRYMAAYWKEKQDYKNMLREYEQYYLILAFDREKSDMIPENIIKELLVQYQLTEINEAEANFTEIMQLYTDAHCYNKARQILDWVKRREMKIDTVTELPQALSDNVWDGLRLSEKELQDYLELFVGREDLYKRTEVLVNGKINYITVMQPLTVQEIKGHLAGEQTLATILQRNNNTVKYMIFDIDISKKEMLTSSGNQEIRKEFLQLALGKAEELQKICQNLGLNVYIEYSGGKGYHVWLFFEEWIATRYANLLQDIILSKQTTVDPRLSVECFPNKTRVKVDKVGQGIKLPWGRHFRTGEYTYFLGKDFLFLPHQKEMLDGVARYSVSALKRIVAANTEERLQTTNKKTLDLKQFGDISEGIKTVLMRCGLMAYLCEKAKRTGYLPHFERLTILYVFGHMGNEGKEFVHQIMSYTLNYQYSITQKYIKRLPEKPISCIKLREQYKQVTAETGCSCSFRRTPNCYPSPVLHVIKDANSVPDGVTIPASREISQKEKKQLPKALNVHSQAEEMVRKMMELRKQERGIRNAIEKQEKGLSQILDDMGTDCIELDMGVLKRSRGESGWEWSVGL